MKRGFVYVFTGEGKGKTSAAIGVAVRAVGAGMKVGWVAFYKQASWKLSEVGVLKKLGVEVWLMGRGFHISEQRAVDSEQKIRTAPIAGGQRVMDRTSEVEHRKSAGEALNKARELLAPNPKSQIQLFDVLVLDEVNNAVEDGLIEIQDVLQVLRARKGTHVIMTGRDAGAELVKAADLVTEMKKVKHPYDKGKLAVKGLDF
jgi:cob(I)alamin adenosyltransferase